MKLYEIHVNGMPYRVTASRIGVAIQRAVNHYTHSNTPLTVKVVAINDAPLHQPNCGCRVCSRRKAKEVAR